MRRNHISRFKTLGVATAVAAALTLLPSSAGAQEDPDRVSARGKGIAGGILLGAEVVMIPIAIAGVKAWWPYVVFGAVGAGGGAVGGYFVEQVAEGGDKTGPAEPSLYMLAGGLALVIPTLVAILNVTAYDPEEDEDLGEGEEAGEGGTEPSVEGDSPAEPAPLESDKSGRRRAVPPAVVGIDASGKRLRLRPGVPAIGVGPAYSAQDVAAYGVEAGTQVHVPIVHGSF